MRPAYPGVAAGTSHARFAAARQQAGRMRYGKPEARATGVAGDLTGSPRSKFHARVFGFSG
jgi:hypothetical protein